MTYASEEPTTPLSGRTGPLTGLRILDTSSLAPGNYATLVLSRLGAEVIKLERPSGDPTRGLATEGSDPFLALNAGKKSVVIDLKSGSGQQSFDRLLAISDVVVENYLPATSRKLRVTYERIRAINPSAVLCTVTGYGETSPRHSAPGHDLNFWAEAGALDFVQTGGSAPLLPVSDMLGGMAAGIAISSALYNRAVTGVGDHVRVSLADTLLHAWVGLGLSPAATAPSEIAAGYGVYVTADNRRLAVAVEERHYWESFCEALDCPELLHAGYLDGGEVGLELRDRVQAIIAERPIGVWLDILHVQRNLPVNEVMDANSAARMALGRNDAVIQQHEGGGLVPQSLFSSASFSVDPALQAPLLGEHTQEFLDASAY